MSARASRFEVVLEDGARGRLADGRSAQLVTVRLVDDCGNPVVAVRLQAAEARDHAVRLLEVAHVARVRRRAGVVR
jgi:hypothetical protein